MKRILPPLPTAQLTQRRLRTRSWIGLGLLLLFLVTAWRLFVQVADAPREAGTPRPLRRSLVAGETFFSALFDSGRLAPTYPLSAAAKRVRVNGHLGFSDAVDTAAWRLNVVRPGGDTLHISLDEIKKLPKKDIVFDFKCIEGWSQVTHWAGVPLKTFLDHYGLRDAEKLAYVGLRTPDGKYYVGIDMPSALHPQTLLCYEMNGAPLPLDQGYPLRLIIPVKYGIKHLKRIGTMHFSQERPPDFWAEQGYDYYSGH